MLTSNNRTGLVFAEYITKADGPFVCNECNGEMILKKGHYKIAHFAHKSNTSSCSDGETAIHLRAKYNTWRALSHLSINALPEVQYGNRRCDVSFRAHNINVAIEYQNSFLSYDEILARTKNYENLNVAVCWVALREYCDAYTKNYQLKLTKQELFMLRLNFGHLYVSEGNRIWDLELTKVLRDNEYTSSVYTLKTKKDILNITEYSFGELYSRGKPLLRAEWKGIPKALLWVLNKRL